MEPCGYGMRIRRLELIGFKSFPFATTIEFPYEGITAIVGPNGCGKSNVLDALMWVMGATSPKLLRSRSMEDVIFAGSENLEPLGRAEVRLTIDNTKKLASEPYREIPEIEIRRVFYRDGESEFWLNGRRCRLRDIQEFFLGTGLGTNSYAIIEQGKVDAVTLARPEGRRLFLDESAGISKYKERREIALRKMEATKQNLSRVEDILHEVTRQANRLKRQAGKARRYQRLKERLNALLIRRAELDLLEMDGKREQLNAALQSLSRQAEAKEAEWKSLDARVSSAQARLLEQEEALRALNAAFAQQRDALGEKRQAFYEMKEKRGRVEEALKGLRGTAREAKQRLSSLAAQKEMLEQSIQSLEESFQERARTLEEKKAAYQAEKERLNTMEERIERHKQAVFDAMAAEVDAKNRLIELSTRSEETRRGIEKRQKELQEAEKQYQILDQSLTDFKAREKKLRETLAAREEEKRELETSLNQAVQRENRARDSLKEHERKLMARRSDLNSLEEIQKNLEDVSSKGAKTLLKQFFEHHEPRGGSERLVADMIEIDPRYDRALEATLRDELEFIMVDNHEIALKGLAFLKEKNAGRSGLIPRDALRACPETEYPPPHPEMEPLLDHIRGPEEEKTIMACLLKDVWVVEDYAKAVEIRHKNGFAGTLVTLEGDIFYPNGVIVGGSDEPGARTRVGRNRKISALKQLIEEMEKERSRLFAEVEEAEAASRSLKDRRDTVAEEMQQTRLNLSTLLKDLENTGKNHDRVRRQMEVLRAELDEMNRRVRLSEGELSRLRQTYEDARREQARLREKLESHEKEIQALRESVEKRGQETNRLRVEEAEAREKLQNQVQKLKTLREEVARLNADIEQKRRREDELSSELRDIREQVSSLERVIREMEVRLAEEKKRIEASELELRKSKESIRELEAKKSETFKALQKLKEEIAEKRLNVSQRDLEIDALIKETRERFGVDLRERLSGEPRDGEETWDEEEARSLEKKIASLGEINFVAIQEFEELKERISFLEQQRADLLDAIQTLTETIQRINRVTSTRFKETYEKVQHHFADLFTKLFGGGKGELRLTDPTNYRETGIDIFAQPPGKRLQAIRLLSGGEKALVALAFLFAMFLTRPSPFCVLDEVDAPLDEGNIDRFNQLLVEWSDMSQFILITHNKRTMARAKSLFGVTMEQPGVSKIISVSLEEVEP